MTHVLLVEPDKVQAAAMRQVLKVPAYTVNVAANAQAAVAQADLQTPDIVILELMLPAHNGIEFLHEFRSYQEWANIPIVIFTSQKVDDTTVFKMLGRVTYLYKPVTTLAELKRHVRGVLA